MHARHAVDMVRGPAPCQEVTMSSLPRGTDAPHTAAPSSQGGVAADQLRSIVERIERLEEEKKALADDIKEVYAEAKGNGFDTKILRKVISLRKRDRAELDEEETLLEVYLRALGMLPGE